MGNFLLHLAVVVVFVVVAAGHRTNAARVKLQRSSSETSLLQVQGLLVVGQQQVSPLLIHADESVSPETTRYLAQHVTKTSWDQGYYGFMATMDVYGFSLSAEQYSSSFVQLHDGADDAGLNMIQIGWEVAPKKYNDSHTHLALAVMWTSDGYQKTRCLDAHCALGLQPEKGAPIAPGGMIRTVSQPQPMGLKQNITIKIVKDGIIGDWLVYYGLNGESLTLFVRFPRSLFNGGLANRAAGVQFGGHVISPATYLAPMGSGYCPMYEVMASASMSNIQLIDQNGRASPIMEETLIYMTDSHVYTATPIINGQFFYGGPVQLDRGRGLSRATWLLEGNRWLFITMIVGYCMMH